MHQNGVFGYYCRQCQHYSRAGLRNIDQNTCRTDDVDLQEVYHYETGTRLVILSNSSASCVWKRWVFFSRTLNFLRTMSASSLHPIPVPVRKDIPWWKHFIIKYNGKSIIPNEIWQRPDGGSAQMHIEQKKVHSIMVCTSTFISHSTL